MQIQKAKTGRRGGYLQLTRHACLTLARRRITILRQARILSFVLSADRNNPVQRTMGNALSNTVEWVATCGASANRDVLVVIDPISTGAVLASQAVERGLAIIAVWSESVPDELKGYVDKRLSLRYIGVVQHVEGKLKATARAVRAISGERLKGVLVGCETGVLLGDALAEELGQRGNGTKLSPLRRNKWLQTEAVRESGANACIQSLVTGTSQVEDALESRRPNAAHTYAHACIQSQRVHTYIGLRSACIQPRVYTSQVERVLKGWPMTSGAFKAVVKPCEGAGSDGVTICNSKQDVRDAFLKLDGTRNVLGLTTYEVLVQEYLVGDEYVVDTVSRDGVHKCVAIWKYDKRIFNGSPVVYYGARAPRPRAPRPRTATPCPGGCNSIGTHAAAVQATRLQL